MVGAVCAVAALAFEAGALALRRQPLRPYLSDCSVLVTATLLAIALPPYAPWWLLLVGTASVETSEQLSTLLGKEGIRHEVLNAKHHEREASIVARSTSPEFTMMST